MHKNIEALRKLRMTNSSCPEDILKLSKPIIQSNNPSLFQDESKLFSLQINNLLTISLGNIRANFSCVFRSRG